MVPRMKTLSPHEWTNAVGITPPRVVSQARQPQGNPWIGTGKLDAERKT